ncbi:MAG: hypothetical protein U0703_08785 [Anaerolineae bacterium]
MEQWSTRLATLEDTEALQQLIAVSARGLNGQHYPGGSRASSNTSMGSIRLIRDQTCSPCSRAICSSAAAAGANAAHFNGDRRKAADPMACSTRRPKPPASAPSSSIQVGARRGIGSLMRLYEQAASDMGFRSI